jgi:hypothetical protein
MLDKSCQLEQLLLRNQFCIMREKIENMYEGTLDFWSYEENNFPCGQM